MRLMTWASLVVTAASLGLAASEEKTKKKTYTLVDVQLAGCNTDCGRVEVRLKDDDTVNDRGEWLGLVVEPWTLAEATWACASAGFGGVASVTEKWASPSPVVFVADRVPGAIGEPVTGTIVEASRRAVGASCRTQNESSSSPAWASALVSKWLADYADRRNAKTMTDVARKISLPSPFGNEADRRRAFIFADDLAVEWQLRHAAVSKLEASEKTVLALQRAMTPVGLLGDDLVVHPPAYFEDNVEEEGVQSQSSLHAAWLTGADSYIEEDEEEESDEDDVIARKLSEALRRDGYAFVDNFGLSENDLADITQTATKPFFFENRSIVSTTSDGRVQTARVSIPTFERLLLRNETVRRVVLKYLGNDNGVTADGYKATWLKGLESESDYIASLWHHDRVGKRLKLFLFLHDVDCLEGHPTQIALKTHKLRYYKTDSFAASRFQDEYVRESFNVATACGARGGGFLFDTHSIHKGTPTGKNDRLTIIAEFHDVRKCPTARVLKLGLPCPSGDQFILGEHWGSNSQHAGILSREEL